MDYEQVPHFMPGLHVQAFALDRLFVVQENRRRIITDVAMAAVVPLIDNKRSVGYIVDALAARLAPPDTVAALAQLVDRGVLRLGRDGSGQSMAAQAFWALMGAAQDGATTGKVALVALGGLSVDKLAAMLAASGIAVAGDADNARLKIVLTDDYLRAELGPMSARAANDGVALLLVKPVGIAPTMGPLIHPVYGSCLTCLQFWTRLGRPVEHWLSRANNDQPCHLPIALDHPGEFAVHGLVAACIASLLTLREDHAQLKDGVLQLDMKTLQSQRHRLVKRPQCPGCGDAGLMRAQALQPPALESVPDLLCSDGGYRKHDPARTFEKYKHLINPVCGPISYLHTMPRRHAGLRKVYVAGYMVCPQEVPRANSFDKICAGKGQTDEQARASALCEALERYSSVYQGDEARVRASMDELRAQGQQAVAFNSLQHYSDRQFAQRERINAGTTERRLQIPAPYTADRTIDWTPAWSLATGKRHYVPLTYCYAEAPVDSGAEYGIHNPNGAAAGNCLEEAILQGLLELVERDATALWWYNRIALTQIDLASFGDPYFERLVREYASLGWNCWVLDLTHDLGITVCAAIAHHSTDNRWSIGFGCHLDARLAVQRALTEVNQLFDPDGASPAPWDRAKLSDTRFLFPDPAQIARKAGAMGRVGGADLRADIAHCVALMKARDMDVLVVDKTRPDIGLSVVQVIVPELRHFWPRLGPGRLYDVAPALGWLPSAMPEDMLNPVPLFL